jgi:hypothetical protein
MRSPNTEGMRVRALTPARAIGVFSLFSRQYDLYTTSYSPDGRVFQVEYAAKAVESSGTAVGVRCKDGVVLGFEKLVVSKMLVEVCCGASCRQGAEIARYAQHHCIKARTCG